MYDVINPGIFPVNEKDADALVTAAAYGPFRSSWYGGIFTSAQGGIHVIGEMTTDIGYCQWNDAVWPDLLDVNFTPSSNGAVSFYKDYSNYLGKMTLALDRISNIEMNEDVKKRLQAERIFAAAESVVEAIAGVGGGERETKGTGFAAAEPADASNAKK